MSARTTPEHGDVVIRQEQREGRFCYVLHTVPGDDQYMIRSREDAVAQAVTFARRMGVRAWLANGERDFALLEDFRAVEPV